MTESIPHESGESPARELAIVARSVIDTRKRELNNGRPFNHQMDKFEPDIADFEKEFADYIERICLRERVDTLRKYERFGMVAETVELTTRLNELNMKIAMREHPDVR